MTDINLTNKWTRQKFRDLFERDRELQYLGARGEALLNLIPGCPNPASGKQVGVAEFYKVPKSWAELRCYPPSQEQQGGAPVQNSGFPGELLDVDVGKAYKENDISHCSMCRSVSCGCLDTIRRGGNCRIMEYEKNARYGIQAFYSDTVQEKEGDQENMSGWRNKVAIKRETIIGELIGRFEPYQRAAEFKTAVPFKHPYQRTDTYLYQISFEDPKLSNWARHLRFGGPANSMLEVRAISGQICLVVIANRDILDGEEVVVSTFYERGQL
ncbi:hypothetical protein SCUP515_11220 [Seiridium cupressi]